MKKRQNKILIFSVCLIVAFLPGIVGGLFTSQTVDSDWYTENKPDFTPPNYIFGPVWTILYLLIGLSLYFAWIKSRESDRKALGIVFAINLVLNGLWSYLFFSLKNPLLSFIDLIFILLSIFAMIYFAGRIDRKAGWLLVPYLLWVIFAGVLNFGFL